MTLPAQPNQSLIDGLAVLTAIAGVEEAVGSRDLARRLGLESTRVNRLLKTLAALGLAEQDEHRRYRPGPGIHVLAAQSLHGSGLIRRALPHLESLHCHGFIVALGVLWRDQVCYLYHGEPGMRASDALGRISLQPATQTGLGTMLLACQTDQQIKSLFHKNSIPRYGSMAALMPTLKQARRDQGIRVEIEPAPRLRVTLAVPVGQTRYAAIGLSGAIRADQSERWLKVLRETAAAIDPTSPNPKPSSSNVNATKRP